MHLLYCLLLFTCGYFALFVINCFSGQVKSLHKSRSLSNDAMVRRNKRDECVSYPVLFSLRGRSKKGRERGREKSPFSLSPTPFDACYAGRDETKQARQMSNIS